MSNIDSDTEAIERQLIILNEQIGDVISLLEKLAEGPRAEDAPVSATETHENPPNEWRIHLNE
jgi:hypothetical protein